VPERHLVGILCRIILGTTTQGSFDSVAASLREAATPLKMTTDLWLLRLGGALAVDLFEDRVSAALEQSFAD
jgi:hypothetical protein